MARPTYIDKAVKAFNDNSRLSEMSEEERRLAAEAFEETARIVVGKKANLAYHYNLERAKFLRGEVHRIAKDAHEFNREHGFKF